ncbi:hypothetical protein EV1_013490 [Malus domestica]|uniref:VQ motif-containing protein 4-like n=1 Tax=Malus sylvestris TaxID=3752 RepID=UPI0021AC633B|nr:VQ motif-containing protein 4-like [Malus sylvestris]
MHQAQTDQTTHQNNIVNILPIKITSPKKQGFKLYERRSTNLKNTLMINTLIPNFQSAFGFSPRHQEIISPSLLNFQSLTLNPVMPLNDYPFDKLAVSPSLGNSSSEEDRAIAEKGFYLHPSSRATTTPRDQEPRLLPLFSVTSPRVSGSSS